MMNHLIDPHCHILPAVDDGARDLEEARRMLRIAKSEGIRCIIATPHHHPQRGKASPQTLRVALKILRREAENIDEKMRIYLGTELYFGQDIVDELKKGTALTMNKRKYVLVEFRPSDDFEYIRRGLQMLQMAGYEVILAHVERYMNIVKEPELAEELCEMGIHLQVNAGSILGNSGRHVKKFVQGLLEEQMIYCVGTDAHDSKHRPPKMKKAAEYVVCKYGKDYARRIFVSNAFGLLKKQEI